MNSIFYSSYTMIIYILFKRMYRYKIMNMLYIYDTSSYSVCIVYTVDVLIFLFILLPIRKKFFLFSLNEVTLQYNC